MLAVAVPVFGIKAPDAVNAPVNVPDVKAAAVPLSAPVSAPPLSCRYRPSVYVVFRLRVPLPVIGPPVRPVPLATLVTVPPELGAELVIVTEPPNATVPPPDNPDPAVTVMDGFASKELVTPPAGILIVPLLVIGPPVSPVPVATLVTVPVVVLDSVTVPPSATAPPPDNPVPAFTVRELLASIALVTPAEGMLIVPLVVIGPPVKPAPVATLVTVPLAPGNVCPEAKAIMPFLEIDRPVSPTLPGAPNNKLSDAAVLAVSFPVGSACQSNK